MCGIIAVLRGPDNGSVLRAEEVLTRLGTAVESLISATGELALIAAKTKEAAGHLSACLLYTSDAADE